MIGSSIIVCAAGIMFTSGQFTNRPDLEWQVICISVAVILVMILSLFYLGAVFIAEVFAESRLVPCLLKCFGQKHKHVEPTSEHGDIELNDNPLMRIPAGVNKFLSINITKQLNLFPILL